MSATLIAITGPSGFRKSRLLKKAINLNPDKYVKVISYTDRPPQDDEQNGVDFYFISEEEFTSMIESETFLEWQRIPANGFRFGKVKEDIQETLRNNEGKVVFAEINVINLPVFKRYYPIAKSIFIDVKDTKTLIGYLRSRADVKTEEEFERLFKFADEERRRRHLADFIINMQDNEEESLSLFYETVEKCLELV